ncbi:hypothetical protein [Arsukibacterium indicum]|uniref:DUF4468 domain-containing protein n=1 Tax=Arsukibacterium indicum TaxID=2848612 RepID=A0ABS6MHU3_9GAMM|nr:hypothetical protein [Arsukibacterium indicum]MBV2128363.1 hypothetical protein [Arsukibacterium indicum]
MKKILVIALMAFVPCVSFAAKEYLEEVESEVHEVEGTVAEISLIAKSCIAQNVRNEGVRISDSAAGNGLFGVGSGPGQSDQVEGGSVIVSADVEHGSITANNRVDYRSKMLAHNVKSTMTFLAKDGKFKIRHTNIEYLQKSTGSMRNSGYSRVGKWFGSGWKDAEKALSGVSDKVAECVKAGPEKENW